MTVTTLETPQPPEPRAGVTFALAWVSQYRWVSAALPSWLTGNGKYWWSLWRSINSTDWVMIQEPVQVRAGQQIWWFDTDPPDNNPTPVMYRLGARSTNGASPPDVNGFNLATYTSTINVPPVTAKPYRIHATVTPYGRVDLSVTTHPPLPGDGSVQPWSIVQGARQILATSTTRTVTDHWPPWNQTIQYDLKDSAGTVLDSAAVIATPMASVLWDATTSGTAGRVRADIQSFTETFRQPTMVLRGITSVWPPAVVVDRRSWREGEIRFLSRGGTFPALEGLLTGGNPLGFLPPCTPGVNAPAQMVFAVKGWSRSPVFGNNPTNPDRIYTVQYEELWPTVAGSPYG